MNAEATIFAAMCIAAAIGIIYALFIYDDDEETED